MFKFILVLLSLSFTLSLTAARKPARELAVLIRAMVEETSIHPDSLYAHIGRLESRQRGLSDPEERTVTQAALGYLYHQCGVNAPRYRRQKTQADSASMALWTRSEFMDMARRRYAEAMADLDILYHARISDWVPVVKTGKDDALLGKDMLMLVWRESDKVDGMRTAEGRLFLQKLVDFYEQKGQREEALWVGQRLACQEPTLEEKKAALLRLKDRYQDLLLNAKTYWHLAVFENEEARKVAWLEEGLKRYPRYKGKSNLQQDLDELQCPRMSWRTEDNHLYPGKECSWILQLRNIASVNYLLYRLPDGFDEEAMRQAKSQEKYLKAHAERVEEGVHPCAEHPAWEEFSDTIRWKAPGMGRYALVLRPSVPKGVKAETEECVPILHVTGLMLSAINLPAGMNRIMVSNAVSGRPIEGAELQVFIAPEDSSRDTVFLRTIQTDGEGKADLRWPKRPDGNYVHNILVKVTKDEDRYHPECRLYYGARYFYPWDGKSKEDARISSVNVYTDRRLYRPSQTVHVGGVDSYREYWQEGVRQHIRHKVQLRDPNGKVVDVKDVETDSMGVFALDFTLPASCLTGYYSIAVDGRVQAGITVEEYKRPTFEVSTDKAPALRWPADSITLTGRAMTYSGVPVRHARVAGTYRWERTWWWPGVLEEDYSACPLDTVFTDGEGRFQVRIPLLRTAEQLKGGRMLNVQYDVTSATGETHTARQTVFLSSTPLNLLAQVPATIDRDKMQPWSLSLWSATGTEVEGKVKVMLKQDGKVKAEGTLNTGKEVLPEFLKTVPSGRYELHLLAVVEGDTASFHKPLVLFGQHDTRLVSDTLLWCYTPETEYTQGQSIRFLLGTSREAWIHYTLVSDQKVVSQQLLHLNDTIVSLQVPYEEQTGTSLTLNVMTLKEGKFYADTRHFHRSKPDKQLKYRWTTFRDHLQPGQQETWSLELLTPDGKPAKANLMASLYDASLDAIRPHSWSFYHRFYYNAFPSYFMVLEGQAPTYLYAGFRTRTSKAYTMDFGGFNPEVFTLKPYGMVADLEIPVGAQSASPKMLRSVAVSSKNIAAVESMGFDTGAPIRGKDLEGPAIAGYEEDIEEPTVAVRENFQETAFFYPTLRTDDKGIVTLSFTLPESLTEWHLLGLAHTQDMLTALLNEKVVARKDLMAQLSLPRFLRQGDKTLLTASLYNIGKEAQKGRGVLTVLDAATEKVLLKKRIDFRLKAEGDTVIRVPFQVPQEANMLVCRWVAEGTTCSDGEQRWLPVLTHREWVTETKALTFRKPGRYQEDMKGLFTPGAAQRQLTVEYVSQPAWYAVQALPSLAWPEREDVLSLASAYYAGALAGYMAQQNPAMQTAFQTWQGTEGQQVGKLSQQTDVKHIALEETPWVALAEAEKERTERLASLFDPATQSSLQKAHLDKLRRLQQSDGSFAWYPGMKGSYYLTREVAYLLTRQKVLTGQTAENILQDAVGYIRQDRPTTLCTASLRYLYVLYQSGVEMNKADRHHADSLLKVLKKHPEHLNLEDRALAALILKKAGEDKASARYLETVKRFLVTNEEGLTYFEFPQGSQYSINRKLHVHVQVMEALAQLSPGDTGLLEGMQRYLLTHKRTTEWDSPVITANAVYSLLLCHEDVLQQGCDAKVTLQEGRRKMTLEADSTSFGYVRQRIEVSDNTPTLKLSIEKQGAGESWGGIYAQYLAPASEVKATTEGDLLVKVVLVDAQGQRLTGEGNQSMLKVGTRIHVRYEITAKRDFEYVFMKAPRPATAEPAQPLSGFRWGGGLGYYRAVKDAATHFYFDRLPRGSYAIEEDWFVEHEGCFRTGLTTIQCLYAPEFCAHAAESQIVTINNE